MTQKKITKKAANYQRIINLAKENPVILTHRENTSLYSVDGETIHKDIVEQMLSDGYLVPTGDALFEGITQTYVGA